MVSHIKEHPPFDVFLILLFYVFLLKQLLMMFCFWFHSQFSRCLNLVQCIRYTIFCAHNCNVNESESLFVVRKNILKKLHKFPLYYANAHWIILDCTIHCLFQQTHYTHRVHTQERRKLIFQLKKNSNIPSLANRKSIQFPNDIQYARSVNQKQHRNQLEMDWIDERHISNTTATANNEFHISQHNGKRFSSDR